MRDMFVTMPLAIGSPADTKTITEAMPLRYAAELLGMSEDDERASGC